MEQGNDTPEALIAQHLAGLQADPARSSVFSAYIAALTDDAGWGVEAVAGLAGASRQSISKRRKQGRELRLESDPGLARDLAELPLPPAPAKTGRTRSGLRIPDGEEIAAKEATWVAGQFGPLPESAPSGTAGGAASGVAGGTASGTAEGAAGGAAEGAAIATAGAKAKAKDRAVREQWQSQLKLAAGLMEDAEEKANAAKRLRASVAWTLTCFDPKAGQGLQKAGHWQPDEFFDSRSQALAPATELKMLNAAGLRDLAKARGIHPPEDLERERDRYFTVTSQLLAAQARRKAATQMRDALVRGYVKRDATGRWRGVTEVAGWIGRTQSQVTQICDSGPTSPSSDARGQGTGKG